MAHPFKYLTIDDHAYVLEASQRKTYAKDDIVISQGEIARRALFIISSGVVRIEIAGTCVARFGPGSVLGVMGFLEHGAATTSIIADSDLEIDITEGDKIDNFCASVPGFATRFYHSLALILARRLREATNVVI